SHASRFTTAQSSFPAAAVILAVRGADPSLERCLSGALDQNYPAYTLYIVVDNQEDPALAVVSEVLARGHSPNVKVQLEILRVQSDRCSLKLSAQRQALAQLDNSIEIVVFLDADSVPLNNWLRSMV